MQRGGARVAGVILLLCSMETSEVERVLQEQGSVYRGNCLGSWVHEVCRKGLLWRLDSVLKAMGQLTLGFLKNTSLNRKCKITRFLPKLWEIPANVTAETL